MKRWLCVSILMCSLLTGCHHITVTDKAPEPASVLLFDVDDFRAGIEQQMEEQEQKAKEAQQKEDERKQAEAETQAKAEQDAKQKTEEEVRNEVEQVIEVPEPPVTGIAINDGVDASWVDAVNRELGKAPANVLQAFTNSGWSFHVTPMNIDGVYFGGQYGAVMGVTVYDAKTIYLEDRTDAVQEAALHELGHFVDCYLGYPSDTLGTYDAEAGSYCSYFGVDFYWDRKEFYADSFWKYLTAPNDLKACAPQMYGYWAETLPAIM